MSIFDCVLISPEEAFKKAKETELLVVVSNHQLKKFFFVDAHGIPKVIEDRGTWVPVTHVFPINVVERPGVEDGVVDTFEKYKLVFEKDSTLVESIDDLLQPLIGSKLIYLLPI